GEHKGWLGGSRRAHAVSKTALEVQTSEIFIGDRATKTAVLKDTAAGRELHVPRGRQRAKSTAEEDISSSSSSGGGGTIAVQGTAGRGVVPDAIPFGKTARKDVARATGDDVVAGAVP
ncbi:unnamed protein product, partial [Hapterophycus canaliculatus]